MHRFDSIVILGVFQSINDVLHDGLRRLFAENLQLRQLERVAFKLLNEVAKRPDLKR